MTGRETPQALPNPSRFKTVRKEGSHRICSLQELTCFGSNKNVWYVLKSVHFVFDKEVKERKNKRRELVISL
jgi:hypothetical protein